MRLMQVLNIICINGKCYILSEQRFSSFPWFLWSLLLVRLVSHDVILEDTLLVGYLWVKLNHFQFNHSFLIRSQWIKSWQWALLPPKSKVVMRLLHNPLAWIRRKQFIYVLRFSCIFPGHTAVIFSKSDHAFEFCTNWNGFNCGLL